MSADPAHTTADSTGRPRERPVSPGVPDHMPLHRGTVLGRPDRFTWPVLALVALGGTGIFALAAPRPLNSALSFLGAVVLVVGCFGTATLNVRMASRLSPGLTFGAAVFSYMGTVAVLSLALLASSPRVVDGVAVMTGLALAVIVWMVGLVRASWVR